MNAPPLQVFLFGLPRLVRNGEGVTVGRKKTLAMLAYLTITGQQHSRDVLATLFFPENDVESARANLRREIYWLGQALGKQLLSVDREKVGIYQPSLIWVDAIAFQEKLTFSRSHAHQSEDCIACQTVLSEAVDLYRGDFLAGFGLPDSLEFEDWQFFQSEQLRQGLTEALKKLGAWHIRKGEFVRAIEYTRQWLAIDLLNETVHQQLIQLYAWSGQPAAALRQYQECARLLEEELGLEPDPETTRLYEAARRRELVPPLVEDHASNDIDKISAESPPAESRTPQTDEPDLRSGFDISAPEAQYLKAESDQADGSTPGYFEIPDLPMDPAPFIGRQKELEALLQKLSQPEVRLITIVGLGGMGKTRLALEAARACVERNVERFSGRAVFVPLAGVNAADDFPIALARILHIQLGGQLDPLEEIANILSGERLLLVLDNFEQILDSAPLLNLLLDHCPEISLLVTCREPLHLAAEWRFDLEGLELPPESTWQPIEENEQADHMVNEHLTPEAANDCEPPPLVYESVQLFLQSARQAGVNLQLRRENRAYIYRLCRMVMGTPLAIQLAAYWLRAMPVSQIVDAISENLDVLSSPLRDTAPRQQSMRAVFEYTWRQLSQNEQAAFQTLAVFRGGFNEDAARQVARISPFILLGLRDRGLLQYDSGKRFTLHELARQFASDRLAAAGQTTQISRRHSEYYFSFLCSLVDDLYGTQTAEAVETLKGEMDNIRQAWQFAIGREDIDRALEVVDILAAFYEFAGLLVEGSARFRSAAEALETGATVQGTRKILVFRLWFYCLLFTLNRFHFQEAQPVLKRLEALSSEGAEAQTMMDLRLAQGIYDYYSGNLDSAVERFNQILDFYRTAGMERQLMNVLNYSGDALARSHFPDEALVLHRQSLEMARNMGDKRKQALALSFLGVDFWFKDDLGTSLHYFELAVSLFEQVNDLLGLARTLNNVGFLQNHFGNYTQALGNVTRSLKLMHRLGSLESESLARDTLGSVYFGMGDYKHARQEYYAALASIQRNGQQLEEVWALNNVGRLETATGDLETGETVLKKALELAKSLEATMEVAEILGNLGTLFRRKGETSKSLIYLDHAVSGLTQMNGLYQASQFWLEKGELLMEQGDLEGAEHDINQAIITATQRGRKATLMQARIAFARLEIVRGNSRTAEAQLRSLLEEAATQVEQALIYDALWQATKDHQEAQAALHLYRELLPRSPDIQYQQRIRVIEGSIGEDAG